MVDAEHMRAIWYAVTCVEQLAGASCVLTVLKASSSLLALSS
jgi:hypothetical protein